LFTGFIAEVEEVEAESQESVSLGQFFLDQLVVRVDYMEPEGFVEKLATLLDMP